MEAFVSYSGVEFGEIFQAQAVDIGGTVFQPEVCTADSTNSGTLLFVSKDKSVDKGAPIFDDLAPSSGTKCGIYLAESSIRHAGLGLYTAVDFAVGDFIGEPEIAIAHYDEADIQKWWLLNEVQWMESILFNTKYESPREPRVFLPGFGAAVNCYHGLNNIQYRAGTYDSAGLHRSVDPGTGAFSNYYNINTVAVADIKAGSELFINYGSDWFTSREKKLGPIPFAADYQQADKIIATMADPATKLCEAKMWELVDDIWGFVRSIANEKIRMALPILPDELREASKKGSALYSLPNFIRSPEWLEENGVCADNLYASKSSIPQAGRGAFARRFIAEGAIVAPAPVLQVHRDRMTMYKPLDDRNANEVTYSSEVIGKQLLLNYCYGHRNSSVLLLPYAPIVNFINHGGASANAEIRWSPRFNRETFLSKTKNQILKKHFGLVMEFVALRDIMPNEEILINYGHDWEEAWLTHNENWTPPENSEDYVSASEMKSGSFDIRTENEQKRNPYPPNLRTACWYRPVKTRKTNSIDPRKTALNVTRKSKRWYHQACWRPCKVLDRYYVGHLEYFNAEMLNMDSSDDEPQQRCQIPQGEVHTITHIHRRYLGFIDLHYTRDQSLRNAFRHEIGLSNDVFPTSWVDTE